MTYPLLVHVAVLLDRDELRSLALLLLVALVSSATAQRPWLAWLLGVIGTAAVLALWLLGDTQWLLYFTPVLMQAVMLTFFAVTLLPGEMPLVERFARSMVSDVDERVARYSRRVTASWSVLFVLLLIACAAAPFLLSDAAWSWLTNVVTYVCVALFFAVEFVLRRFALPGYQHPNLWQFARGVSAGVANGVLRRRGV